MKKNIAPISAPQAKITTKYNNWIPNNEGEPVYNSPFYVWKIPIAKTPQQPQVRWVEQDSTGSSISNHFINFILMKYIIAEIQPIIEAPN